jgi:single-strand DNA-binding protein
MNKVILIGNVGKDPEIKSLPSGNKMATLSLATSERWTDKHSGEKKEQTEWHNVVVMNEGIAGVVERYVAKGSKIAVEGKIKTRKWQDKNGQDRYSTEVVLDMRGHLELLGDGGDRKPAAQPSQREQRHAALSADPSDDIPFD